MDILAALTTGFSKLKEVIDLIKAAKDLFPKGVEKSSLESKIAEAENALRLAEAQTAQSLGYQLCQCTFPPQIMLSAGYSKEHGMDAVELLQCPSCKRLSPTDAEVRAWKEQNQRARNKAKGYSVQ